jgi:hypothetical protein
LREPGEQSHQRRSFGVGQTGRDALVVLAIWIYVAAALLTVLLALVNL